MIRSKCNGGGRYHRGILGGKGKILFSLVVRVVIFSGNGIGTISSGGVPQHNNFPNKPVVKIHFTSP